VLKQFPMKKSFLEMIECLMINIERLVYLYQRIRVLLQMYGESIERLTKAHRTFHKSIEHLMFILRHSEHCASFAEFVSVLSKIECLMTIIDRLMVAFSD
jgi:hypothetical protein